MWCKKGHENPSQKNIIEMYNEIMVENPTKILLKYHNNLIAPHQNLTKILLNCESNEISMAID